MSPGERYVAAAYVVVLVAVLVYVAIIALKLARFERDIEELTRLARERQASERRPAPPPPVRASGPVEGVRRNREVPPPIQGARRG